LAKLFLVPNLIDDINIDTSGCAKQERFVEFKTPGFISIFFVSFYKSFWIQYWLAKSGIFIFVTSVCYKH
jgi:hypothetical protein